MKSWLYLCVLSCSLTTCFATPPQVLASPAAQEQVTLQIRNESEQTICSVYISPTTARDWGEDWLSNGTIASGKVRQFPLVPDNYDMRLLDCEGNLLLDRRGLSINHGQQFLLTQTDITRVCETHGLRGTALYRQDLYQEALSAFQLALSCFQKMGDHAGASISLNNMGLMYDNLEQYDKALLSYKRALLIDRSRGDRVSESTTLNNIAGVYEAQRRYDEALTLFEQALVIVREIGHRASQGTILNGIGAVYREQQRYDEALYSFESALEIRREVGDQNGEVITIRNIAGAYKAKRLYNTALIVYKQALTVARDMGNQAHQGTILNDIGAIYVEQGHFAEALFTFEQALAIRQQIGDRIGQVITLNNLGALYGRQGDLGEALAILEQALATALKIDDWAGQGAALDNIAGVYKNQGRYYQALDAYKRVLEIQQHIGDAIGAGTALRNIGEVYDNQGRYEKALVYYLQALVICQAEGDRVGEGITLNNIGTLYTSQGNYSKALASYEQALEIAQKTGNQGAESTTLSNIAGIYNSQGYYNKALEQYKDALLMMQKLGNRAGESTVLNNIGLVYLNQGNYEQALETYTEALAITQKVNDRDGEGITLTNIGTVYYNQGRYNQALEIHTQALLILRKVGDRLGEGAALNNIGAVYLNQRRYDEALTTFTQALAIRQDISDRAGESNTLNNIAVVYHRQKSYEEALNIYEQVLTILQEMGDQANEGKTLNNISAVYHEQRRFDYALSIFMRALEIASKVGDRTSEGVALNSIAGVYDSQANYDKALTYYKSALAIMQEIGDLLGEGLVLNNIGALYRSQENYTKALTFYIAGLSRLENVRVIAGNDQARISFVEGYASSYDQTIDLSHRQGHISQAFWYSEQGRARVLLDSIVTGQVQLSNDETTALLAAEQEAYAVRQAGQNARAKAHAAAPPDSVWVSEADTDLAKAEVAYERAAAAVTAHSDQLASLIPGRQQVLQLEEIQARLDTDTTLLSYWTLEDQTLAFVVTAQDATIVELPSVTAQSVFTLTESLYEWRNLENPHPAPLRQIYQALIAPLREHLITTHLAIIPHQALHYVPFAALVDSDNGKQYLGEQYTLSILPSANLMPFLQQNAAAAQANPEGGAVVFGDPAVTESDLPPLQYAQEEANQVAKLLHTVALTATAATETTLHQAAEGARIVHLAAHGAYNQANALYSAIYLAPSASVTATQPLTPTTGLPTVDTTLDGRLETHEIFGLPLQGNDLVVLSACETNVGELSRGDELVGLTRAFFFAGTPTVIASLWSVDDAATETLMVAFYKHWLQEDMSKAEALQAAQADVRADPRWASPFYWAGFVLNGHPGYNTAKAAPK